MDWTNGYVADIEYVHGYYPVLNPMRMKLAFLNAGLHFPEISNACELGFGQGLSLNFHAAAGGIHWYGNDFNPVHVDSAQELSRASGINTFLSDQSFAEFCYRDDLPEFDYIGLHGVWSWISAENRKHLIHFLSKKLRVGGVAYISYNILPGWALHFYL